MRQLLDTNVFIETAEGNAQASAALLRAAAFEWAGFSVISRVEALGFPKLGADEEANLLRLFGQFVEVQVTPQVIEQTIQLKRALRIKTPDALIAATALVERAELVTRNVGDFQHIPGLTVVDVGGL
jgi:predicted nucleic acid-binding protein